MEFAIGLIVGLVIGLALGWAVLAMRRRAGKAEMDALQQQMREAFASLAAGALDANSQRLGQQAAGMLEGKKALIDQAVQAIHDRLNKLAEYVNAAEKDRKAEFGRLSESVSSLASSAGELHKVLASTQRRGAWGERMADDILRLAGLIEGVNYRKQSADDAEEGRPDFTFLLPNNLVANMDVKFPLENYSAYLDAESDDARAASLAQLVRDVRGHVKAVAGRGYIDPKGGTVSYVIVFIPSEQIFSLVLEAQPDLIDEALRQKVVLSSPLSLYAMLAVIRQAAESSNLMKTADEIVQLMGAFTKQWQMFQEQETAVLKGLHTTTEKFDELVTTRRNMLQKPLDKIEGLRQQRGLGDE